MTEKIKKILILFSPIVLGFISGIFTSKSIETWYKFLNKPSWNPPNWLFGPVWSILYLLMGYAAYIVYTKSGLDKERKTFLWIFYIQLFFNLLWSPIFFNLQHVQFALIWIIALWFLIVLMLYKVNSISKTAFYILIPYLLWVSFATFLNFTIWRLN